MTPNSTDQIPTTTQSSDQIRLQSQLPLSTKDRKSHNALSTDSDSSSNSSNSTNRSRIRDWCGYQSCQPENLSDDNDHLSNSSKSSNQLEGPLNTTQITTTLFRDADGFIHELTNHDKQIYHQKQLSPHNNNHNPPFTTPNKKRKRTSPHHASSSNHIHQTPVTSNLYPPYNYDSEPTLLHMRWFRTGYNAKRLWRNYHSDHFSNNPRKFDQEDHDPASDSSAFEWEWENPPPPPLSQSIYDKLEALGNAGPQEPPSP